MAFASFPARQGQQRSLRSTFHVLSWAFAGCAEFRVGAVGFFLRLRLVLPAVGDLRPGAALAALVGQGDQAGFLSTTGLR
jgi:hypothetical protein